MLVCRSKHHTAEKHDTSGDERRRHTPWELHDVEVCSSDERQNWGEKWGGTVVNSEWMHSPECEEFSKSFPAQKTKHYKAFTRREKNNWFCWLFFSGNILDKEMCSCHAQLLQSPAEVNSRSLQGACCRFARMKVDSRFFPELFGDYLSNLKYRQQFHFRTKREVLTEHFWFFRMLLPLSLRTVFLWEKKSFFSVEHCKWRKRSEQSLPCSLCCITRTRIPGSSNYSCWWRFIVPGISTLVFITGHHRFITLNQTTCSTDGVHLVPSVHKRVVCCGVSIQDKLMALLGVSKFLSERMSSESARCRDKFQEFKHFQHNIHFSNSPVFRHYTGQFFQWFGWKWIGWEPFILEALLDQVWNWSTPCYVRA